MAACWQVEQDLGRAFTVDDVAAVCDIERTQAGRFLRDMERRGLLRRTTGPTRHTYYLVTAHWLATALVLRAAGRLPGRCCECGARSVPFPFLRRFFCEAHLMAAHRSDYEDN
jgi:hypothetical protein